MPISTTNSVFTLVYIFRMGEKAVLLLVALCGFLGTISAQNEERQENEQLAPDDYYFGSYRPFEFAFQSNDGLGTTQHRRESGDTSGSVKGSYGYMDPKGLFRNVEYIADQNGFRAVIRTNEPGTANQNSADAVFLAQPPPESLTQQVTTTASPSPIPSTGSFSPRTTTGPIPTLFQYTATDFPQRYDTTQRPQVLSTGEATISRPVRIIRVIRRSDRF